MYCYKCGEKLDDDARFCTSCGTKVEEEPQAGEAPAVKEQPWPVEDMAGIAASVCQEEDGEEAEETKIIGQLPRRSSEDTDRVEHVNTEEASKPERVYAGDPAYTPGMAGDPAVSQDMYTQPGTYGQPGSYDQSGQYVQAGTYGQPGIYGQEYQYSQPGSYDQAGQYGQSGAYDQGQYGQSGTYGQAGQYGQPGFYDQAGKYVQPGAYGQGEQYGPGVYGQGSQYGQSGAYGQGNEYGQSGIYGQGNEYSQAGAYGRGNEYSQSGTYDQSGQYNRQGAYGQGNVYGGQETYGQNGQGGQYAQQNAYSQPGAYGQPGDQKKGRGKRKSQENAQEYMPQDDKPRKGMKGGVLALIIIGAILICSGIGFLVWSFTGGKSTPEKTISKLEDAVNNKDVDALIDLCDSTSAGLLGVYVKAGGDGLLERALDEYGSFTMELTVKDITYEGENKCTVEVRSVIRSDSGAEKEDMEIPLIKEKGKWKIDLTGTMMNDMF